MVQSSGNRYRISLVFCMGLFSQWSGNGLVSYCECFLYQNYLSIFNS